jgi:hypothetical protein
MINDLDYVERVRGTYAGGGMASIGPAYDRWLLNYRLTWRYDLSARLKPDSSVAIGLDCRTYMTSSESTMGNQMAW